MFTAKCFSFEESGALFSTLFKNYFQHIRKLYVPYPILWLDAFDWSERPICCTYVRQLAHVIQIIPLLRHHIFFASVHPEARTCEICATSRPPNPISRNTCTTYSFVRSNCWKNPNNRKGWGRNPIRRTVHANSTQPVRLHFVRL